MWPTSGGKQLPLGEGDRAAKLVSLAIDEVTFRVEMVVDTGVNRDEFLQRLHPSKSQHRPFSSTKWQVGIFSAIVEPPPHLAPAQIAEYSHRCRVGSQPIRDNGFGPAVPLQRLFHETQSRRFVPFPGDIGL